MITHRQTVAWHAAVCVLIDCPAAYMKPNLQSELRLWKIELERVQEYLKEREKREQRGTRRSLRV